MNTITPVQAKVNLYNNQQIISKKQSHNPTFKGALGDKVVKQLVNKEKLTVAGILALTAGVIGLNKEKVSDVIESLKELPSNKYINSLISICEDYVL